MDHLTKTSPYHRALLLWGLSKRQEEEKVKPELVQAMEYLAVVRFSLLNVVTNVDHRAVMAVEGLDLMVTDLELRVQEVEWRQGNLSGIQGVVAEAWGKAQVASDTLDVVMEDAERISGGW